MNAPTTSKVTYREFRISKGHSIFKFKTYKWEGLSIRVAYNGL